MNNELETFFHSANRISESDYGDYMRQANFHLNKLKEEMERLPCQLFEAHQQDWESKAIKI